MLGGLVGKLTVKPLLITLALSFAANGTLWLMYRTARAEADRAVSGCNVDKVQTELNVTVAQRDAAEAALTQEREAREALADATDAIRVELDQQISASQTELEATQNALRLARRQSRDDCVNRPYDRDYWLQFRSRARATAADSDPGGAGPGSGTDSG